MKQTPNKLDGKRQRTLRHPLLLCLLSVFMAIGGAGCKPEAKNVTDTKTVSPTAAELNPVGTYALVTVDGNKVPCTVQHEGHTMTVKSGTFIINADATCSSKVAFSMPSGGDANREVKATYTREGSTPTMAFSMPSDDAYREVKATYTREGSTLTMKWEGAGMTTGTVAVGTFTLNNEGMIFAYRMRGGCLIH